jgi:cobalt/nickel transport system permease protein
MIGLIDTLSYTNRLRSVSPMWKCAFAAYLFLFSYAAHPVLQLAAAGWLLLWTVGYARIPGKPYLLLIAAPCLFYAASLPAMALEFRHAGPPGAGETELFTLLQWTVYVTEAGLERALLLLTRVVACVSCMTFLILTTPVSELLQVMKRMRMPALVLELMVIMYRFLFVLTSSMEEMRTAQLARGGYSGFRGKIKDSALLGIRLFVKAMHRYKGLSHGLAARGFTEEIRMAPYRALPMPLRYRSEMLAGGILLFMMEVWLRWSMK